MVRLKGETAELKETEGQEAKPIEGDQADAELAALAKALGHPARVQILRLLSTKEVCICGEIVGELPLAQSTVSQHLKVLREVGLITAKDEGTSVYYCLDSKMLRRLKVLIAAL